jgi:hypothetical protein
MRPSPRSAAGSVVVGVAVLAAAALTALTAPAGAAPTPGLGQPLPPDVIAASAAPGSHWTPGPAAYGVGKSTDLPVTMADGTVLRADVYYPTDPDTKERAQGRFPVILTQTPYGKGVAGEAGGIGSQTGPSSYLVERGYIDVVADVRGTGDSQGTFGLFDPVQDRDGVALVRWAADRRGSDGRVGLYGASYLGINQLLTAAAVGRHSPVKAIFPVVPANDLYRDTATMGGLVDIEFDAFYLALTGGLNSVGPLLEGLENPADLTADLYPGEVQHLNDLGTFDAEFTAHTLTGGASAYEGRYWHDRNPADVLTKVVANHIPAYLVGGEYDLFQRGEPMDFAGLQNAWAGRPVQAPMSPAQPVTGRYQLVDGPFTHLGGAAADLDPLMLEWFDTWLKGKHTGMAHTPTPLHYYDLGAGQYTEHARYPFGEATPTRFYFSPARSAAPSLALTNHSLSRTAPTKSGADVLLWSPVGNPCGRATDQWSAGALSLATSFVTPDAPCVNNDLPGSLGLDRATYTTAPLTHAKTIAGPIDVTVYASATTRETQWVAQVEDVAPDGTSVPLTEGALLGSMRAQSAAQTWRGADGQIIKPGHTYTKASAAAVRPGRVTRYDIEVFPTYATLPAGHRIRITLATADTPHLAPTGPALAKLLGGVYGVQLSPNAPSAVEIPLISAP